MSGFLPVPGLSNITQCEPVQCNAIIPADRRFDHWYQTVSLAIGATAVVIPILLALIFHLVQSWGNKTPRGSR
jgi:hypothetical protein